MSETYIMPWPKKPIIGNPRFPPERVRLPLGPRAPRINHIKAFVIEKRYPQHMKRVNESWYISPELACLPDCFFFDKIAQFSSLYEHQKKNIPQKTA